MHEMQTIVTDDCGVSPSVYLLVCHAAQLSFAVQKRLNESRCCLGPTLFGAQETLCCTGNFDPPQQGEGEFGKIWSIVDPHHISGS